MRSQMTTEIHRLHRPRPAARRDGVSLREHPSQSCALGVAGSAARGVVAAHHADQVPSASPLLQRQPDAVVVQRLRQRRVAGVLPL